MADHLGDYDTSSTVYFQFTTHATAGGPVAPLSAFEAADLTIYKNGSATQRTSSNGVTMTSPFDSIVGLHAVAIDLSDNTDAGFYAAGGQYSVVLNPDSETVDSVTVLRVLAYFTIERVNKVNVTKFGGTAGTFASGVPEVNTVKVGGQTASASGTVTFPNATLASTTNITAATGIDITKWSGTTVGTPDTNGYPKVTIKSGIGVGEISTFAGAVVNVTNVTTVGSLTGLTASDVAAIKAKTDNLPDDPADDSHIDSLFAVVNSTLATLATYIDTEVAAIKAKTDNLPSDPADASDIAASFSSLLTTAMTESYATDGSTMTVAQALYMLLSLTSQFIVGGTSITCKKLDGTTTAMVYTTDDATNPTQRIRTS